MLASAVLMIMVYVMLAECCGEQRLTAPRASPRLVRSHRKAIKPLFDPLLHMVYGDSAGMYAIPNLVGMLPSKYS